jgi:hypothetical protein
VVTIKPAESVSPEARSSLFQRLGVRVIRTNRLGYADVEVPPGTDVVAFVRRLREDEAIESVEVNTIGEYVAPLTPNDPTFPGWARRWSARGATGSTPPTTARG